MGSILIDKEENYGYLRVAAAVPRSAAANPSKNSAEIIKLVNRAAGDKVDVLVFPELCISSKNCGDLFFQNALLKASEKALLEIAAATKNIIVSVGLPLIIGDKLYNCAVVLYNGRIHGIIPKTTGFNESRYFSSAKVFAGSEALIGGAVYPAGKLLFDCGSFSFAVEIGDELCAPISPSAHYASAGALLILNTGAIPSRAGDGPSFERSISMRSEALCSAYAYCGCGISESTAEETYSGRSYISESGRLLAKGGEYSKQGALTIADVDYELLKAKRLKNKIFAETQTGIHTVSLPFKPEQKERLLRKISPSPFMREEKPQAGFFKDIFDIQRAGIYKKLTHIGITKTVIGVSGGLDSAIALISLARCYDFCGLDRREIIAVTMPGFGTSGRTYDNAVGLIKGLGLSFREISIKDACLLHFKDIGLNPSSRCVAYENAQARERTQILMDIANMENALVIGTGDMSESCLGFCTYNGDQMSMYNPNGNIPKTLIKPLLEWAAHNGFENVGTILSDICQTAISPELLPPDEHGEITQATEKILGSYELNDFFMFYVLMYGFTREKLIYMAEQAFKQRYERNQLISALDSFYKRFINSQFKRQATPDSPQVFELSLSPRGGLVIPCDAEYAALGE